MVSRLSIKNFKSIKDAEFPCKKINVFIGEPNSGKSNIIEALSLMSQGVVSSGISKEVLRYKSIGDLFFDFNINKPIQIETNEAGYTLKYSIREDKVPENDFSFEIHLQKEIKSSNHSVMKIAHDGKISHHGQLVQTPFRFYQYKRLDNFTLGYTPHLLPPYGENLPSLLLSNESYRDWVSDFFEEKGFALNLKPTENEINISKVVNKSYYSYPYLSISETLQRIVFYIMAIKSNEHSILLFDEPESNTFPFYTKFLAERIGLDETNQFFLTTHNPYLLLSLIEKTALKNINVCVTSMKNYETKVTSLNKKQIEKVLDLNSDVFFNLEKITG
jgi:AAA15 family ATPase/GTPase